MAIEGSISLDQNGGILRVSSGVEAMLGICGDDVRGRDISVLSAGEPELTLPFITEAGGAEGGPSLEVRLRRAGGPPVRAYLAVYPLRDRGGGLYSYLVNVTKERPSHKPAIFTEEFKRIFEFSSDAVAVTDTSGSIIDVNPAFLSTYGYTRGEVIGRNPRLLKSRHSTAELYERMWRDILDPETGFWRGEIINVTKGGREVPVLLSINAIKDDDGEIRNFLGIAFNMTRQKEADRLNRIYIDYIVHDIRGPLTSIMANSELLAMMLEGTVPEKDLERLRVITESAQKINVMTSDMLDYSKSLSGGLTLHREPCSVAAIFRESLRPFENTKKGLYINGVPARDFVFEDRWVVADADIVQRIIYNLLSNACKYAATEARVEFDCGDEGLTVHVSDDGRGISLEDAERIFDAFYQTKDGVKVGGAGLGLSIVKSFVDAHEGSVWVEPGSGKGVRFGVFLPLPPHRP